MDYVSASTLIDFYGQIDIFLVIFVRFFAFMVVVPIFSGQNIPVMLKLMISLAVSAIVMSSGTVAAAAYGDTLIGYAILILTEFLNGFIIGFVVYFMFSVFYLIGQLVDYQLGFSMVSVFDPISQIQVPITGNLFYLTVMMFFVIGGGLNYFIKLVFDSYAIIPLGHGNFTDPNLIGYMITIMTRYFELGVIIALPVIGTIVIIDIALGLLIKAVPQMNIFVVGMPVKVFIGLIVLSFILPSLLESYRVVLESAAQYAGYVIRRLAS